MAQYRHSLSDEEWALLMPLLPPRETNGRPYGDHRAMLDAMFYRLCTGTPWRDLPCRFGPWQSVYWRWRQWSKCGLWDRVLQTLQGWLEACGAIDWTLMCIDGTNVRAHRAAAGAKDTTACGEPADHALGRSRGGWGTKVHLVTDGAGLALVAALTPGQAGEAPQATALLERIRVCRPTGTVRQRPERLAGDKAYSHRHIRTWLRRRHVRAVIPERRDQLARRRGRPLHFDAAQYRRRNVVERCVGRFKEYRAVATRFDKLAVQFLATIKLAMIRQHLKAFPDTA
ncbi:IS5 family transposase [Azohydromonas lata]|uniref:IS5 family transposase n=1 Tax=Azohydromonas lata TaxID=45677 RepID=UPI000836BBDF|nr:IS5 family transposase [Azohydromonas lata]